PTPRHLSHPPLHDALPISQTHYILMGLDVDLNQAMKKAVQETVKFLVEERGLNRTDAYSLASIGVDFKVAEAVDQVLLIVGMVRSEEHTSELQSPDHLVCR